MARLLWFGAGFLLGGAVIFGVFASSEQMPPPTPVLRPPTAITITLHPWDEIGVTDCKSVEIPPEKLDYAFRLLTPETYFQGGVHDFITRIVAEAVISHGDGKQTFVVVREGGKNPAVVSVDGRNYFYARNDPDVHAGAIQLIRLVNEVSHAKKAERQPEP